MASSLPKRLHLVLEKIPLRWVLVVPFVLQTLAAVGLVGYFSYRSGQEAVNKLAIQLIAEMSDRVDQHLDSYLGKAQQINQTNLDAIESGVLDPNNFEAMGKYFYRQVRSFDFAYVNFGGEDGSFIGAGYGADQTLGIAEISRSNLNQLQAYSVDGQGNRLKVRVAVQNPQTNDAAWYTDAIRAGRPIWSSIYTWADLPDYMSLSASAPVYDNQRKLIGILGVDLKLAQISHFLKTLNADRSGDIFIVERSGLLVASSEDESPVALVNGKAQRLSAMQSQEPLIRNVTASLIQQFGSLKAIDKPQLLRPVIQQQRSFVQVVPYRDPHGLDWLTVMVIPESEFMEEISANNARTVLLCWLTLFATTALGALTARWITKPIARLGYASRALARGEWRQSLQEDVPIAELKDLATSFNQTAVQLQRAFDRTKNALYESQDKFAKIFRTSPDAINIVSLADGSYLEVNDRFLDVTGYTREEVIGRNALDLGLLVQPDQATEIYQLLQAQQTLQNFEIELHTKSGEIKTGLMSSELIELEGQPYILSIFKDVTDRKQLELALQASTAKLNNILASAIGAITSFRVFKDGSWEIDYVSTAVEAISGYTPEELTINKELWLSCIVHDNWMAIQAELFADIFAERTGTYEYQFQHKNGTLPWLSQTNRSYWDAAQNSWVVTAVTIDITERKQIEFERQRAEAALRENEERLRLALDGARMGTWDWQIPSGKVIWSANLESMFGMAHGEFDGSYMTFASRIHPEDRDRVLQSIQEAITSDIDYDIEFRVLWADGTVRWAHSKGRVFYDDAGCPVRMTGIDLDITARKRAEIKLKQALQQIDTHFDNAPLAIMQWDKDFQILRWSKQAEQIFGWTTAEVKNLSWHDLGLVYVEDRDRVNAEVAPLMSGEVINRAIQNRNYTKDGRVILCQWYSSAVFDEAGQLVSILSFAQDITDRQRAEAALRQSEATNRALVQAIPDLLVRMHRDGTYLDFHSSAKVKPLNPERTRVGCNIFDILPQDMAEDRMQRVQQVLETGEVQTYEYQVMNGEKLCYEEARITPCGQDEVLIIVRDISERYVLDRIKDEFISVVSHELRTPLTAIRGAIGILDTGIFNTRPERAKELLQIALNNSDRLARLVNDILDLERLESGKVDLVVEPCQVATLIEQAVNSVQPIADQSSITIIAHSLTANVVAAPDAIVQTLINLLSNAIKFSPPDSTIWLGAKLIDLEQPLPDRTPHAPLLTPPYILFFVQDQGRGIPADKLETVFGRFQQIDVSDSRQKGGTGLGLAICKSIVQKHQGHIWAESALNQGSTFYFTLPL